MPDSRRIAQEIIKVEKRFAPIIERCGFAPIGSGPRRESNFRSLATSILSQQLSTKAAATITARVEKLAGGITVDRIARLSTPELRSAGVSGVKARALRELARADKDVNFSRLHLIQEDEEIYRRLTPLFGVGRWTVDMFMIFQVGRADIWPTGDLGVRRGWEKVHRLKKEIAPKELDRKGERFRPFRSHLAWYCWRALEE